jgi:polysaccharide pyruvyl transferase CsaB
MKLLLAGYYGSANVGDEAILEALSYRLLKDIQNVEITVISADPESTAEKYWVNGVPKNSLFKIINAMRKCDAFVLGGGGLLQDTTSLKSLLYYLFLIRLSKFLGKRTILLGQGIGPLKNKRITSWALKGVDLITVRDEASAKLLIEIGAHPKRIVVTSDIALLLEPIAKDKAKRYLFSEGIIKEREKLVAVSLRAPVKDIKGLEVKLAEVLDIISGINAAQIVFIPFKPEDTEYIAKVSKHMKHPFKILSGAYSPSELMGIISCFDALIGMRLHSLIFAARTDVPYFAVSYDPKVETFAKLTGAGCENIDRFEEDRVIDQLNQMLGPVKVNSIRVQPLIEKAKENISLLIETMSDDRVDVLGIKVQNRTMDDTVKAADELIVSRACSLIVTPNPEIIMASRHDMDLTKILNTAEIAPADGVGLIIAARLLGRRFKQRVTGIDLMQKLIELAKDKNYRVFLFGGAEGVADEAAAKIGKCVVGTYHGYSKNDKLVIEAIRHSQPDILFIGLGSPRQEKWAHSHLKALNIPLVMCIGGSLDVISGRVKRAPKFMRMLGIEWLYRLLKEPRRFRRMLVLPQFILKVAASRFGLE